MWIAAVGLVPCHRRADPLRDDDRGPARTARGRPARRSLGVIDGRPPLGVEADEDVAEREQLLRTIGYEL